MTQNLSIAVLGDATLASKLGKKGSEGDYTMYNGKAGDSLVVALEPARYPEKVMGLAFTLSMSEEAILSVPALSPQLGEMVLSLDAFKLTKGRLILSPDVPHEMLAPLLKGTALEKYEVFKGTQTDLREAVFAGAPSPVEDGTPRVDISHHFNVKGVGTVILGMVTGGTLHQHDDLMVYPLGKKALVRSIQMQDEDHKEAPAGSRVGLALKNVESDELDKGFVLAPEGSHTTQMELEGKLARNKYYKGQLQAGSALHLVSRLQSIPCKIAEISGDKVKLAIEKPLISGKAHFPRVLFNLDCAMPRVVGRVD